MAVLCEVSGRMDMKRESLCTTEPLQTKDGDHTCILHRRASYRVVELVRQVAVLLRGAYYHKRFDEVLW